MNEAERLRNDIGFAKWYLKDLLDDPLLNSKEIEMMESILRKLENQRLKWELFGFDHGRRHNFHHLTINQN